MIDGESNSSLQLINTQRICDKLGIELHHSLEYKGRIWKEGVWAEPPLLPRLLHLYRKAILHPYCVESNDFGEVISRDSLDVWGEYYAERGHLKSRLEVSFELLYLRETKGILRSCGYFFVGIKEGLIEDVIFQPHFLLSKPKTLNILDATYIQFTQDDNV